MQITVLRCKLHRCVVTGSELHYEGSIGIDGALLEACGIVVNEKVEIYNVSNGERFSTYAIEEARGTGQIVVNGAAARKVQKGDHLIICAYGALSLESAKLHVPVVVLMDSGNQIVEIRGARHVIE